MDIFQYHGRRVWTSTSITSTTVGTRSSGLSVDIQSMWIPTSPRVSLGEHKIPVSVIQALCYNKWTAIGNFDLSSLEDDDWVKVERIVGTSVGLRRGVDVEYYTYEASNKLYAAFYSARQKSLSLNSKLEKLIPLAM